MSILNLMIILGTETPPYLLLLFFFIFFLVLTRIQTREKSGSIGDVDD